jgi:deazaflavin-dependent oxidoreductase (nitroreductase family)
VSFDFNAMNKGVIEHFRANGGDPGPPFVGMPVLILTTKGAKTGATRENPLVYLPTDDASVIFASKAGAPSNPDWFYNLKANPEVTVEQGTETYTAHARIVEGEERDRLYAEQVAVAPQFGEYAASTTRLIPVIVLERTG